MTSPAGDSRLSPGDDAPDLALSDDEGRQVTLSDLWQRHPLVLLFVRHFG